MYTLAVSDTAHMSPCTGHCHSVSNSSRMSAVAFLSYCEQGSSRHMCMVFLPVVPCIPALHPYSPAPYIPTPHARSYTPKLGSAAQGGFTSGIAGTQQAHVHGTAQSEDPPRCFVTAQPSGLSMSPPPGSSLSIHGRWPRACRRCHLLPHRIQTPVQRQLVSAPFACVPGLRCWTESKLPGVEPCVPWGWGHFLTSRGSSSNSVVRPTPSGPCGAPAIPLTNTNWSMRCP